MINGNMTSMLFALLLATFDLFNMGTLKNIHLQKFNSLYIWPVTFLYALQPWIFLKGLNFTSMTVLNLSWDLLSDIIVTLSGVLYFKESLSNYKFFGVVFAVIAIILFALDGAVDISGGSAAKI
jgi:hypothetical protein